MTIANQGFDIGIVGLEVIGQNLLLNIADHNFSAVGYDWKHGENFAELRPTFVKISSGMEISRRADIQRLKEMIEALTL